MTQKKLTNVVVYIRNIGNLMYKLIIIGMINSPEVYPIVINELILLVMVTYWSIKTYIVGNNGDVPKPLMITPTHEPMIEVEKRTKTEFDTTINTEHVIIVILSPKKWTINIAAHLKNVNPIKNADVMYAPICLFSPGRS